MVLTPFFPTLLILVESRNTKQERYGDPNFNNRPKFKQTCQEIWGVDNPFQSEEVKEKIRETLFLYGVEYPLQNNLFTSNTWHNYQLPSGKWIKVQGYERYALDDFLLEEYNEDEILYKCSDIPKIWYKGKDEKWHRYYPDFYIPKDNLIIEVKSTFTFLNNLKVNQLKRKATKENGFHFRFIIYDTILKNKRILVHEKSLIDEYNLQLE